MKTKLTKQLNQLPHTTVYQRIPSPVGELALLASDTGLHHVLWQEQFNYLQPFQPGHNNVLQLATQQLDEYFAGKRQQFSVPLKPHGTPFQLAAWKQLQQIPYGETISYGTQAQRLGDKNKARAVGLANGSNPLSIIVPCHRVIGSNGELTGFGGGMERKAFLLELEGILCPA